MLISWRPVTAGQCLCSTTPSVARIGCSIQSVSPAHVVIRYPTSHLCCETRTCASILFRSLVRLIVPSTSVPPPCRCSPSQDGTKCFHNWTVPPISHPFAQRFLGLLSTFSIPMEAIAQNTSMKGRSRVFPLLTTFGVVTSSLLWVLVDRQPPQFYEQVGRGRRMGAAKHVRPWLIGRKEVSWFKHRRAQRNAGCTTVRPERKSESRSQRDRRNWNKEPKRRKKDWRCENIWRKMGRRSRYAKTFGGRATCQSKDGILEHASRGIP